jgi:hypothetical protein
MPKNQISSTRNLIYIIKNLKGSLEAAGYQGWG